MRNFRRVIPTFTVNVVSVLAVLIYVVWVDVLGIHAFVAFPSLAHVNVKAPIAINVVPVVSCVSK